MKKTIFSTFVLLLLCIASYAQNATNRAYCDITIRQICYDLSCTPVSSTVLTVPAGTRVRMPAPCRRPFYTVYEVCWTSPCMAATACVTIDGSVPISPCGPGTYTGTIQSCDYCANFNGTVAVTFDPTTGDIDIVP